ncbi:hypothetical protein D3Y59_11315 [Hymenobacter oligotrophus]|uniref:Uncharacterized protein n=1 Tax=Hymenobacter oligotrophus TaxID=2319843 RepID=A0A3B7R0S7_9BACT|nr:hypothetical protein [Hymenobacter oligotrophus]AYA37585.1 hypothetical protein D3Y59_11315 [Hymenobacter oligotrophus]
MISTQLTAMGFVPTKHVKAGGARPAGVQYERKGPFEPMCVFVALDETFAEIVLGPGQRPRVYGRGRFSTAEDLGNFLRLHAN